MASFARVKELLLPGSGIRNFMEDYTLADWDPDDNSGRLWLFGAPGIPDAALPERHVSAAGRKGAFAARQTRSARGWGC